MTVVAITGASGFLGRALVDAAQAQEATPVAIVRREPSSPLGVQTRTADLRDATAVAGLLHGVSVLIHAAAAKGGEFHEQYASTVRATEVLLAEAERAGVRRVVLVSSFSVYDYAAIPYGSTVNEESPTHLGGVGPHAYAQAKSLQEQVTREWAVRADRELVVVRPGAIYGRNNVWTGRIGQAFGSVWVGIGSRAEVPATFVENCASAIAFLAAHPSAAGQTYNILDSERPTQADYRKLAASAQSRQPRVVPVPWSLVRSSAEILNRLNSRRAAPFRVPGFANAAVLDSMNRPLAYSDAKLAATGWRQRVSLREAFDRLSQ
ncbi:NAD-dependent epimerase/dehydratase family protein [Mycolicibacterium sp.]|uniref:NAD-dependent epimerase/dehydratase family protein n=1 Tax=Mycolicibacterium sp. TaxID=2320850 RepID=UPI001A2C1FD4|nr:NAD-dependent epimerase/dehydratase family protein [Mycolicibacterium sp.]MBJ7336715.1 NAD-dependent epimerase/dehydratase family protein [Mycolicibacterium sp.]